jgi:hypothetical protein
MTEQNHVKMAHIWQACCDLWKDMEPRTSLSRVPRDVHRRNAFVLAAGHYGFSHRQIAAFIHRERSTIFNSVRTGRAKREREAVYALSVHYIITQAQEIANNDQSCKPQPPAKRDHVCEQDMAGRVTMTEGSKKLLSAIVREHPHFFEGCAVVKQKLSTGPYNQAQFCSADKILHGNIAA